MNTQNTQDNKSFENFRFEIFKGRVASDGTFAKTRTVGHAYLRSGKHAYRVKLFGALSERFVIVPKKDCSDKFTILTKEEVQTQEKGKRTYWNVVGDGETLSPQGVMKLDFDLYGKPLFMSLYPSNSGNVPPYQTFDDLKAA
jgi:hypothetical protein